MANDFRSFSLQLDAFAAKVKVAPSKVVKRVAFDLFGRIVKKTPWLTGRARASWTIAVNQADRRVMPPAPPGTVYPRATAGFLDVKPGDSVVISNNLPYITALEDGHSRKAPLGMVKLSIEEVKQKMATLMAAGVQDAGL